MAKIFTTSGTGASQTLNEADSNKLKVYDDYASIDTTDLVDGEIVSTKETAADGSNVYDYVNEQIADAQSYSTEETLTGGTWIDGKPIYRKVWTGTFNVGRFTNILPEGLVMISITGYIKYSQDGGTRYWVVNAPENKQNETYFASVWYNSVGFVQLEVQGPFAGNDSAIIFEYTKATD